MPVEDQDYSYARRSGFASSDWFSNGPDVDRYGEDDGEDSEGSDEYPSEDSGEESDSPLSDSGEDSDDSD